jgi:hypothetical protein
MTSNAIPGPVDNEITIMGQVGWTAAGEDEEPSTGLHSSRVVTLVSAVRTASMNSM